MLVHLPITQGLLKCFHDEGGSSSFLIQPYSSDRPDSPKLTLHCGSSGLVLILLILDNDLVFSLALSLAPLLHQITATTTEEVLLPTSTTFVTVAWRRTADFVAATVIGTVK